MRRGAALVAVMLAACGAPALPRSREAVTRPRAAPDSPVPSSDRAAAPPGEPTASSRPSAPTTPPARAPESSAPPNAPAAPAPSGPPPTIAWDGRDLAITGLPAIAADGRRIVVAHRDSDGGRGNPNLTLIVKDREDRELERLVVFTSNDVERVTPVELTHRFEVGTRWLRERHAEAHLQPMTAMVTPTPVADQPAPAVGAGMALRWTPDGVTLEGKAGWKRTQRIPASWLAPDHPLCRTCTEVCHNEAFLGGGFIDVARAAVLIIVEYRGTDTCWEPSPQEHVFSW